jgi:hypothetical protein
MIPRCLKLSSGIALSLALSNCVHQNVRQVSPGFSESRIAASKTIYVRKHGEDDNKLGEEIAAQLQEMGYKASVGTSQSPIGKADATLTYTDHWMWDITMYMISLDMQLREPGSDMIIASAKTTRSSLVRKSQKEMVRETLTKLLKNQ